MGLIKNKFLWVWRLTIQNLYIKPKLLLKVCCHPSILYGESYFSDEKLKSKTRILTDRLFIIFKYGTIDEYYYMYGLDRKAAPALDKFVVYLEFMQRRDKLNLSNPHNDSCILRNKLFFGSIARLIGIRTPNNVGFISNHNFYSLQDGMTQFKDWSEFPNVIYSGVYYIKPIDGECGQGIFKIKIDNRKIYHNGCLKDVSFIQQMCQTGTYIVQAELHQHPEMTRLYPNSVNTIRMTTVRNPKTGNIEILPPTLRVGAHGSFVDNFSQGGVIISMDTVTGKLAEWGFFKPKYGFKSKVHPDTQIKFSSFEVPFYKQAKEMATFFHSFLNLHSIGWDIAIDENGPVFIEGNDNWEINLPQTYVNPYKDEFNRLFK